MDFVKAYYAKLNNMGDLLNEYLIPSVIGKRVIHCENVATFQIMGVGSCGGAIWGNKEDGTKEKLKDTIKHTACSVSKGKCAVWGTGFLKDYYPRKLQLLRNDVSFIAVRGALSKRIIEHSLGIEINPVMCDGGILAAELFDSVPQKRFGVGLIPHYNEQHLIRKTGIQEAFENRFSHATLIDLRQDPLAVIKKIGECELILSSSLHGCVVADSFRIPNMRIKFSDIPGSGFKFDDYYSGFGLDIPPIVLESYSTLPSEEQIVTQYQITNQMVELKKKQMANCLTTFVSNLI